MIFALNFALLLLPSIETCLVFDFGYAVGQVVCFAIILVKLGMSALWRRFGGGGGGWWGGVVNVRSVGDGRDGGNTCVILGKHAVLRRFGREGGGWQ